MFTRDLTYKGITFNYKEIKDLLVSKGYKDIRSLYLTTVNDEVYAIINNINSEKIKLNNDSKNN